jgi:Cu/Ag efflux protein CusF
MRAYVISIGLALGFNVAFAGPAGTAEGTVNEVKSKAGKLNITHGTISDLMEAMTMDFEVVDSGGGQGHGSKG